MEHSELIHKFIDEGLDPIAEQSLFEAMAKNPALRSEFKQYLAFERAALTDYSAFQPSVSSTNAIFSTLGISPTVAGSTSTSVVSTSSFHKFGTLVITNVATMIITALLFYFLNSRTIDNPNLTKSPTNLKIQNTEQNSVPIISNFDKNSKNEQANNRPEKIKYVYIDKQQEKLTDNEENQNINTETKSTNTQELNIINSTNFIKHSSNDTFWQNTNHLNNNKLLKINAIQLIPIDFTTKNFSLENVSIMFTGNDSYSLPQSPLPRSSQPLFDSKSLVLFYDISTALSLGLDVRQEFYYLNYTGQQNSKDFRYEQNTNFTSIGLVGKWNWLNYENFKSFANLYVGGNQIGQIGRLMIGAEINPSKEYGFIIGVEGSLLRHFHQNREFWAKKIGLNYGIIFHFN